MLSPNSFSVTENALRKSAEVGEWPYKCFHDQITMKECAKSGDQTGATCMPSGHASDRATGPGDVQNNISYE